MIKYPKVSVIILNWNGKLFLEQFMPSVYNSSYPNLEIVLGDNASTDDSVSFIQEHFPTVKVIINDRNYGFAEGYNRVLTHVEADYLVLLNSDVEVSTSWIEPVIRLMESDPNIAAAQPKLRSYYEKGMFEYAGAAGGFLDKYGYPFCRGRIFDTVEKDIGQYDFSSEIFWASGAALFIKKHYWDEMGGFDAGFFAHMEEIDLCWRLKNRGHKIMYCAESVVYHVGAGTLNKDNPNKTYLNFRNNLAMLRKNLHPALALLIIITRFWLDFFTLLHFLFNGKFAHALSISKAHVDFLLHIPRNSSKTEKDRTNFNSKGMLNTSIVWQYFVKKKKRFPEIKF